MTTNLEIVKLNQQIDIDKETTYYMTVAQDIQKMSDIEDGTVIKVDAFATFTDEGIGADGEPKSVDLVSVLSGDETYASNSATFKAELLKIFDIMGKDEPFYIVKMSGISKGKRDYITCTLARKSQIKES